ncbi:MAG: putative metalloprotease CJM1_0395 family protein [Pelobacteraceae bacterium]
MEPVSSTYGRTSATDPLNAYRASREDNNTTDTANVNDAVQSTPAEPNSNLDAQLGIQPSKSSGDEFRPYGPGALRQDNKTTEPATSEQKSPQPAQVGETKQEEDPRVQQTIAQLKSTEEKVKAHEAAHKSGGAATGPVSYSYTRGPDGKNYITAGEVPITISTGSTPQETISRMQQVIQAALAPADPSPQDRAVAAQAAAIQQEARQEQADSTQPGAGVDQKKPAEANNAQMQEVTITRNGSSAQQSSRAYSAPAVTGKEDSIIDSASRSNLGGADLRI